MYHIIVNPASKTGKGLKIWHSLFPFLEKEQIKYQVYFTEGILHGIELARNITKDLQSPIDLIVLGGDGTINEVIQGLHNTHLVTIGYIPTGSSNDLARALNLHTDPLLRLSDILQKRVIKKLDIGQVTYKNCFVSDLNNASIETENFSRLFAVACGIGFDAAVCKKALTSPIKTTLNHLKLGKLTYLGIALQQLAKAPKVSCELILDNDKPLYFPNFLFIASMIHRYEGGGFMFCPNADAADGLLDICVAGNLSFLKCLCVLPHAFSGNHLRYSDIFNYRAKDVCIKTSLPLWVQTDGEVSIFSNEIHLTNLKTKLQFIC